MAIHKYKAFISYSHADEREGEWLQRALENFRAPRPLVGQSTPVGEIPRRLTPVFRDRDDLPAAGNLNDEIQAAIAGSHFLIVLCSPNAAASRWVNEEVKLFKKLHGQERLLAVIAAGEPGASAIAGREAEECFPPALRFRVDERGEITSEPAEPIAADARKDRDGKRYAILKLAAGLMGVGLDDLVQRDAHRRARIAWSWAGASTALTAGAGLLAAYAVQQGDAAKRMRDEADGLVSFMLGDFHESLTKVGRLDLLDSVGERALTYYGRQNERSLTDDALAERAKALLIVGQVDQTRKDLDAALLAFQEASDTTAELLRRAPRDPQRIFNHAQSVFYAGDIARIRGDLAFAETQFLEYLRCAQELVSIDPASPEYRLELAYATSNLGALKYDAGEYDAAVPYFEKSVAAREALWASDKTNAKTAESYAYALSWLAFGELLRGNFAQSVATIDRQMSVYDSILGKDPENFRVLGNVVTAQRRRSEARLALGDLDAAKAGLAEAEATVLRLLARESANSTWKINAAYIAISDSAIKDIESDDAGAAASAEEALGLAHDVSRDGAGDVFARTALGAALARRLEASGDPEAERKTAEELGGLFSAAVSGAADSDLSLVAGAGLALSRFEARRGDEAEARAIRAAAIKRLDGVATKLSIGSLFEFAQILAESGDGQRAQEIAGRLDEIGYRHPGYSQFRRSLQ
ncbi:MAG: toll/interleukin-1 receptor domain-containing protein [Parvularculaceae bacterium]